MTTTANISETDMDFLRTCAMFGVEITFTQDQLNWNKRASFVLSSFVKHKRFVQDVSLEFVQVVDDEQNVSTTYHLLWKIPSGSLTEIQLSDRLKEIERLLFFLKSNEARIMTMLYYYS